MFARAPASSANLGPGFDTLAVALEFYVEVAVEVGDELNVKTSGEGAGRFDDERHPAVALASSILGHRRFSITVSSSIPLSRGLGSSAALAVATAAAAGSKSPMAEGARIDGHAENAAASTLGGLVVATQRGEQVVARSLPLDPAWSFVVVVPEQELSTAAAREVLPERVTLRDAVANLNALGLLIAGLGDHRAFDSRAMEDHLHQPYRSGLLPFADELLERLRDSGAAGACWSGAGSAMLALVDGDLAVTVADGARDYLFNRGVPAAVHITRADRTGLVTR